MFLYNPTQKKIFTAHYKVGDTIFHYYYTHENKVYILYGSDYVSANFNQLEPNNDLIDYCIDLLIWED